MTEFKNLWALQIARKSLLLFILIVDIACLGINKAIFRISYILKCKKLFTQLTHRADFINHFI